MQATTTATTTKKALKHPQTLPGRHPLASAATTVAAATTVYYVLPIRTMGGRQSTPAARLAACHHGTMTQRAFGSLSKMDGPGQDLSLQKCTVKRCTFYKMPPNS